MAKRLRSPIVWLGGKGHMIAKILPLLPPHKTYVEPWGGGASILIAKPPSEIEIYNDLDSDLVMDNTAGVCSTGVAAENTKRYWICIEKELEYYAKVKDRFDTKEAK